MGLKIKIQLIFTFNLRRIHKQVILNLFDNSDNEKVENKVYRICNLFVGKTQNSIETPVPFKKNENLHQAYLYLEDGAVRDIEGNIIQDNTVVEFYYNND